MLGHAEVDLSDAKHLVRDLEFFARRAVPHATRNSLNASAFEGRKLWTEELARSFTLRNTFTVRGVRVAKARGTDLRRLEARLGSVRDYQKRQEQGAMVRAKRRHVAIPTAVAAGQAKGTRPRTKRIQRAKYLSAIRLKRGRRRAGTERQRNAAAVREAAAQGGRRRFLLLEVRGKLGMYELTGRKKLTVRMIYDLSRRAVLIKREPTLQRTLTQLVPRLPALHVAAVLEQLRRHRILGY